LSVQETRFVTGLLKRFEVSSDVYDESFVTKVKSNPDLLSSLVLSVDNSSIIRTDKVENIEYKTLDHSEAWNGFAIAFMNNKDYTSAKKLLSCIQSAGASDASTTTNYAAVLMNEMVEKGKIVEKTLNQARDLTFRALKFYVRGKGELIEGALTPPFKNLVLIRNLEAELFLQKQDFFTAYILAWISVEMSLTRIWLQFLKNQKRGRKKRKWFADWDIAFIIEALFLLGIVKPKLKNDLDCQRQLRNEVIHGLRAYPEEGQISRCIELGRALIPILQ
jgi:hypothetical protein